ncbi:MAG: DUF1840 domain-containing protein [Burkholderiaceae bacterium]|jgi:ElaB/YqjD/DUF883 family membrane-anchored ribosome-binding protein|nr:DUF1840 domain-containing protein [Burkholderiaceae bacterium]
MLYKFKSQVAAEVIMLQPDAEALLKIIGKQPGDRGIITVEQIADAVAALRKAIADLEAASAAAAQNPDKKAIDAVGDDAVTLKRRAAPFIDLLERSLDAGKDVVWGV